MEVKNTFPAVKLELLDCKTGKTVLEVGTENTDDYYPCFVANWSPENMACNQSANEKLRDGDQR